MNEAQIMEAAIFGAVILWDDTTWLIVELNRALVGGDLVSVTLREIIKHPTVSEGLGAALAGDARQVSMSPSHLESATLEPV